VRWRGKESQEQQTNENAWYGDDRDKRNRQDGASAGSQGETTTNNRNRNAQNDKP
jgi:hypothetical protein